MFSSISLGAILKGIGALLGIADKIATYMEQKQLMDAGRAKQQKDALREAQKNVKVAANARKSVVNSDDRMRNDKYNRDNK